MFHINQSGAICSEFEARLCKFMVIPLATLQRGVSIREEPRGGKERIGGRTERERESRQKARQKGVGKVRKEKEKETARDRGREGRRRTREIEWMRARGRGREDEGDERVFHEPLKQP